MNFSEKTFSLTGSVAEAFWPYSLTGNTEKSFSFAAVPEVPERCFTKHCDNRCFAHTFMLTIDVTMDALYHLSEEIIRRLGDAVFTVVGFVRQQGAEAKRLTRQVVTKLHMFVQPVVRRMVNLRL